MAKAIDWAGCIQKVKETVKSTLPDEDILDMLRRAKAAADRKKKLEGNLNDAEFIRDFANDNLNEAQRQALLRKLQQLNAIRAYRQRSTHVKMALKAGMSNFEADSSLTVTSYKSFAGAADSVEARQKAKSHQYGNVYNEIELAGYSDTVRKPTPEFERDFAIEKAILDGLQREGTGNKVAKEIAEIFHKYTEMARLELNGLGADIGRLEGRIARQTHDRLKIKKYSYEEWRDDMLNWGDQKSFDWIDPDLPEGRKVTMINEWLGQFHENVRTGVHNEVDASDFGTVKDIEQFKGPANQAKKVSQSRKFHFKSPEDWLAYNKKYGSGSVFKTLFEDLERSSKQYGLWSVWGVNPQAAFDNHLQQRISDLKNQSAQPKKPTQRTFEQNIETHVTNAETLKEAKAKVQSLLPDGAKVDEAALKGIDDRLESREIENKVGDFDFQRDLAKTDYPFFDREPLKITDKNYTYSGRWAGKSLIVKSNIESVGARNVENPLQVFQEFSEAVGRFEPTKFKKTADGLSARYKVEHSDGSNTIYAFEKSSDGAVLKVSSVDDVEGQRFSEKRDYVIPEAKITDQEVQNAFNAYMAEAKKQYVEPVTDNTYSEIKSDPNKELDKFRSQQKKLRNQFDQVSGAANIAVNPTLAAIGSTYRTITMLARLGGIAFSTLTDVSVKTSVMRHNGIHVAQGTLDSVTAYFKGLGPEERQRFLSQFIVLHEGSLGYFTSHLTEQGSFRGWMSKAHHFFGKYTGLEHITNGQRASMGMALTHNIANLADRAFSKLDPKLQGNLIRYNIDQASWDVLRKAKSEVIKGKSFIGTDGVKELDLAEFTDLARNDHPNFDNVTDVRQTKLLKQARDQLERRYRQYVVDQIDESITKVGAREKAVMFGGTRPGTPEGEALRLFWQFKSFGLAYVNRHLRRELGRYGKVDIPGVVQLMVGTTFFGLTANALTDVSAGRIPRALNDPKTWLAAFIRGGGAGIYGDFLFGEYSRYGSSPLAVLSGPGIGNIESALRIMGNLRDGEGGKAGAEMFRLFKSHVPFQNLFYTKQVTDYLIFNQLLEVINPGYLKRTEDNLQKKFGQSYFLPPSSMVKEGGGFR